MPTTIPPPRPPVPLPPAGGLPKLRPGEILHLPSKTILTRIYTSSGRYATAWHQFRYHGPLTSRFEHHPPPEHDDATRGILFASMGKNMILTAIAEFFQTARFVDRKADDPYLVLFELARSVPILDVRTTWTTRAGTSDELNSCPRPDTQPWGRAIYEQYPNIEGIAYRSRMNAGNPAIALFERAFTAIPQSPRLHRPLSDTALKDLLRTAADKVGYLGDFDDHSPLAP